MITIETEGIINFFKKLEDDKKRTDEIINNANAVLSPLTITIKKEHKIWCDQPTYHLFGDITRQICSQCLMTMIVDSQVKFL